MKQLLKIVKVVFVLFVSMVLIGASVIAIAAQRSILPANINMSVAGMDGMSGMGMSTPDASTTSITQLVAPPSDAPIDTFTLTVQTAKIDLGNGKSIDTYTYNGAIPGPVLRVQQDDQVAVTVINHLPVSTTVHWHGISVPNAEDGVAGLTQDAIKPGESYTYRFITHDVGTYWYHSHQDTSIQLPLGLFGAIIVLPRQKVTQPTATVTPIPASAAPVYDRDYTVFLHEWNVSDNCRQTCPETLSVNNNLNKVNMAAKPGEKVRLRIVNSGNDIHMPVLIGAPYEVIALDGHDLNSPSLLTNVALPISAAQRYDLSFVMPASGSVALIDSDERADPVGQHPTVLIGDGTSNAVYPVQPAVFDFSNYGAPAADQITPDSHFDVRQDMVLNNQLGFFNGQFTMTFPINSKTYPNIPSIQVKLGDWVELHFTNTGDIPHSMHLHGHFFTVLTHNGKPLTGSPVHLDTITINPGESYAVGFIANNPGLWMLHCHMVDHDAHGMDMMLEYAGYSTPFTIGKNSGNNPF